MKEYKNILLINYGGIGDEILFLSTISSLKKQYPSSKITLALEPRSKCIKDLTDEIDDIICVDIKAQGIKKYFNMLKFIFSCRFKGFDCVISSGKSPLVAVILFLTGIKERIGYNSKTDFLLTKTVKLNENCYASKMYHSLIEGIVNVEFENPKIILNDDYFFPVENYAVIHPGVSKMSVKKHIFKSPKLDFWSRLIEGLLEKGKNVVLLGTYDDKDLIEEILKNEKILNSPNFFNYYGKTKNIKEMAQIMKSAQCVICADSAPMHVAIAVSEKVYAVFAPTNELKLTPKSENIKIIQNDIACRPCLWDKRTKNCEHSKCLDIDCNLILNEIN